MDKKIKEAWVEALRSDDYTQGFGKLCFTDIEGVEQFCCLGVLIDIAADGDWEDGWPFADPSIYNSVWTFDDNAVGLPLWLLNNIGLDTDLADELADDNDDGKSFKQIANKIERLA